MTSLSHVFQSVAMFWEGNKNLNEKVEWNVLVPGFQEKNISHMFEI